MGTDATELRGLNGGWGRRLSLYGDEAFTEAGGAETAGWFGGRVTVAKGRGATAVGLLEVGHGSSLIAAAAVTSELRLIRE